MPRWSRKSIISSGKRLGASAELDDVAAVAFGGAASREDFEVAGGAAFSGDFFAQGAAGLGFAVKSLGEGGGAASFTEGEDFNVEVAAVVGDVKLVANVDFAGGLGGLAVGLDASQIAGAGCEGAGLEEAGGPEEFVDADGVMSGGCRHVGLQLSSMPLNPLFYKMKWWANGKWRGGLRGRADSHRVWRVG